MLAEGRLLVPVLHGQPYLDKPPLLYWLVMSAYRLFGVHDTSARLVPGLAGLLTVLLTYLWGRGALAEAGRPRAALCGALLLCLMPEFVYRQRMLTPDALLCLGGVATLAFAHLAVTGPRLRRGWWALAGLACGLGLLTKGPVALALAAVPVLALQFLDPRCARVTPRAWLGFLSLALGLAAPWYLAVTAAMPDFAGYFFWKHNVVRFVRPFDHGKPAWFYLPALGLGLLPWALLLPGFVRHLARRRARAAARRPAALGFFLLCFLWGLLFFSAAGSKRPTYLLPVLPPLALALGCYLDLLIPRRQAGFWRALSGRGSRLAAHTAALALALGLGLAVLAGASQWVKPSTAGALAGATLLGLGFLLAARRRVSWAGASATVFVLLLLAVLHLLPAYNRHFAVRGHLRRTLEQAARARARGLPVACYPRRWDSVSFYLPKARVRVYDARQRRQLLLDLRANRDTLLLVKSGPALKGLLAELPPGVEFVAPPRRGAITVGWVRARDEAPGGALARR
jgi:4-amino-4-deoxy-L-arabinose transferase-like glycosyltransferase